VTGRATFAVCLILSGTAAAVSAATAGSIAAPRDGGRIDAGRIDAAFAEYARAGSPGCATGLVVDGRLAWSRGYGLASLEQDVPNRPSTVFDLGSTSKHATAAVVALLARDGRLGLDDDVRRVIPEVPDYGRVITVRHLLTHTSGLRDYTDLLAFQGHREEDVTTVADALRVIALQRGLNFEPGTEFRYCNTGFFLASILVERVTGRSLRAFASDRLFAPLGMTHTLYMDEHTLVVPGRATAYEPRDGGGFRVAMSDWEQTGDGGVQSSVEEMALWAAALDAGTVGGRALTELLETPGHLKDGTPLGYGLGLFLDTHRGLRLVQHAGAWAGFRAMLLRAPERRLAVITLCNIGSADTTSLSLAVLDAALDASPAPPPAPPPAATIEPARLRTLAGLYVNEHLGEVAKVEAAGTGLRVEGLGVDGDLIPEGGDRFRSRGERLSVDFDKDGKRFEVRTSGYGPAPVIFRRAARGAAPPPGSIAALAGSYASPEIGPAWVVAVSAGGTLQLTAPASDRSELTLVEGDLFDAGWGLVRFQRDESGRGSRLVFTDRGLVGVALQRVP
jgi:CubicO group peptidase (beta-lactamase class C family)